MATMSRGSSTTHTTVGSRRASWQMPHSSPSDTLKQRRQNEMRSFTSVMARARRTASSLGSFRRWKAMRWADLGPTPGRRPSSSMRSWTGPAYTSAAGRAGHPREAGHAPGQAPEVAEVERAHGAVVELPGPGHGVVDGGQHQVLEHLHVSGVDGLGVDADGPELHAAGDAHLHHAPARLALDLLFSRGRLRLEEALLHGLGLLEEAAQVEPAVGAVTHTTAGHP